MSFKATLRIFEKEYPLLDLDYGLKQQTDTNYRPISRASDGKLYLKFASTKDDTALYDAMFSPTQMVKGSIRVYKRDGFSKSFDIEFANAYIIHLQEDYNADSEQPLSMQLIISPQIQRIRNTIFELPANPSNPFEN
ncbi:type VI secretion system tube protein TssD [Spongiivirga citrea]|uniref:Type VI secretion system needle protein Hcp n=1 Tax=Spongiivirga citrea TaxID=1481457 RepID=A0A6M0CRG6_9FLAO|nr:type VI secretion system tube protein TssD [Spongiivirga citrea]NER18674.1 hypothetical protein [Spongiivirga citrea]